MRPFVLYIFAKGAPAAFIGMLSFPKALREQGEKVPSTMAVKGRVACAGEIQRCMHALALNWQMTTSPYRRPNHEHSAAQLAAVGPP